MRNGDIYVRAAAQALPVRVTQLERSDKVVAFEVIYSEDEALFEAGKSYQLEPYVFDNVFRFDQRPIINY